MILKKIILSGTDIALYNVFFSYFCKQRQISTFSNLIYVFLSTMKTTGSIDVKGNDARTHELKVKDELYINPDFLLALSEFPEA